MKSFSISNSVRMENSGKVAVLGGGSWATAIVKILNQNHIKTNWWMRDKMAVNHINKYHHNPNYLSSVKLPKTLLKPTVNLKECLEDTEWVILAIPSAFIEEALEAAQPDWFAGKKIISGVKGIVYSTNQLITDWFADKYHVNPMLMGAIAGPCHAEEIALEKTSYLTIASANEEVAKQFSELLKCRFVKTSYLTDIDGVEYAAVLKNIVAMTCGIVHGLGGGDNFQAVLVSNAIIEIGKFLSKTSPGERNIMVSAYLGDLLVTSYSQFSRNRTFGTMIGRGYSVNAAKMELKMVAEGYYATESIHKINQKYNVELPIVDFAHEILYQKKGLYEAFETLKNKLV